MFDLLGPIGAIRGASGELEFANVGATSCVSLTYKGEDDFVPLLVYTPDELNSLLAMVEEACKLAPQSRPGTAVRLGVMRPKPISLRVSFVHPNEGDPFLLLKLVQGDWARSVTARPESVRDLLKIGRAGTDVNRVRGTLKRDAKKRWVLGEKTLSPVTDLSPGIGFYGEYIAADHVPEGTQVVAWYVNFQGEDLLATFQFASRWQPTTRTEQQLGKDGDEALARGETFRCRQLHNQLSERLLQGEKVDATWAAKVSLSSLLCSVMEGDDRRGHTTWLGKTGKPILDLGIKAIEADQVSVHDTVLYLMLGCYYHSLNPDRSSAQTAIDMNMSKAYEWAEKEQPLMRRLVLGNWYLYLKEVHEGPPPESALARFESARMRFGESVVGKALCYPAPYPWVVDWLEEAAPSAAMPSDRGRSDSELPSITCAGMMSAETEAAQMILGGYSHYAAFEKLRKERGLGVEAASKAAQKAGEWAPVLRHQLHARAESYNPSSCCDYCGKKLEPKQQRSVTMRWMKKSFSGSSSGDPIDARGYLCEDCRSQLRPGAIPCMAISLAWSMPLVALGGVIDLVNGEILATPLMMFLAFLAFMFAFQNRAQKGLYRGVPADQGWSLKTASFRTSGLTFGQFLVVAVSVVAFSGGCGAVVDSKASRHALIATIVLSLGLLAAGVGYLRRGKADQDAPFPSSWCREKARNKPKPGDPELAERECARLFMDGKSRAEVRRDLHRDGVSADVLADVVDTISLQLPFMRSMRQEHCSGGECDYCGSRMSNRRTVSIPWKYEKKTVIPLYFVTITSTETEGMLGYHLLCDDCERSISGRGAAMWAKAGALGAFIGPLLTCILISLFPGLESTSAFWLPTVITIGLGVAWGYRQKFRKFPASRGFRTEAMTTPAHGIALILVIGLVSLLVLALISSYLETAALKMAAAGLLSAAAVAMGFKYSIN